jgi:4-diphosphocytidyl-2-C-methyl-D-erythritol kinase
MVTAEKAYGKINLSIDIVGKMEDGYHAMRMVMQSVSLCDDVTVRVTPGEGIAVKTNLRYLPNDARNIAARAAAVFYEATGITGCRTEIDIKKRIPVGAGLGGGSADGAAVLRALNRLHNTPLTAKKLESLAEKIGSDVPFCVRGGTALAEGRGEKLTEVSPLPDCFILICKPIFSISTPELFSRIQWDKIQLRPDTEGILRALREGSLSGVARRMYNVFEDVLTKERDDVETIRDTLLDYHAQGAVMTGTGSAVFGLFDDENAAKGAFSALKATYPECYLVTPVRKLDV